MVLNLFTSLKITDQWHENIDEGLLNGVAFLDHKILLGKLS